MSLSTKRQVHEFANGASLPYDFVSLDNEQGSPTDPRILYVQGYAEEAGSTEALLTDTHETAGVQATALKIDFSQFQNPGAFESRLRAVQAVGREVVPDAMEAFSREHAITPTTVAQSMGALLVGMGIEETNGEHTGNVAVVNPMGFTVDSRTGRVYRNRSAFLGHYGHALVVGTNPTTEELYFSSLRSAVATIGKDLRSRTFPAQLTMANETDALPAYYAHAQRGNVVLILSGDNDKLFRNRKIQENLALYDLVESGGAVPESLRFEIVPGLGHQDVGMAKTRRTLVAGLQQLTN